MSSWAEVRDRAVPREVVCPSSSFDNMFVFFVKSDPLAKLITHVASLRKYCPNLTPKVGANEDGADLVYVVSNLVGADLPSAPISFGADLSDHLSAEMDWRRSVQVRLHSYWGRP